jgi:hypothetical protein
LGVGVCEKRNLPRIRPQKKATPKEIQILFLMVTCVEGGENRLRREQNRARRKEYLQNRKSLKQILCNGSRGREVTTQRKFRKKKVHKKKKRERG